MEVEKWIVFRHFFGDVEDLSDVDSNGCFLETKTHLLNGWTWTTFIYWFFQLEGSDPYHIDSLFSSSGELNYSTSRVWFLITGL